jgi:hypothetical protein
MAELSGKIDRDEESCRFYKTNKNKKKYKNSYKNEKKTIKTENFFKKTLFFFLRLGISQHAILGSVWMGCVAYEV